MIKPGDVISHTQMCLEENAMLQRGMNFHLNQTYSVILMSVRKGAPYEDRIEDVGKVLIYEGHDVNRTRSGPNPKSVDQPRFTPNEKLTANGLFFQAAENFKNKKDPVEKVKVYEKIKDGIWAYAGIFELIDAWLEKSGRRKVFKFKLVLTDQQEEGNKRKRPDLAHNRIIPTSVKLEVYKRDKGVCVKCGAKDNLHFDHIYPFSKGGTSITAENIQLLCARHNLEKRDKIE